MRADPSAGMPLSPSDPRNGMHLCATCDTLYGDKVLTILEDGSIKVDLHSELLSKYSEVIRESMKKLNSTKVHFSKYIDKHNMYPSSSLLMFANRLPISTSADGRKLKQKFEEPLKKKRKWKQDDDDDDDDVRPYFNFFLTESSSS
jgi:hypothetical protein